ncbi:MAG: PAS domain S-box protein, partial [Desulfobulbus sp.]|nr:PAS domain S-box protein [Desulfobulbus sp.]
LTLLATLILAGLFYLPYLWVRNRTIDDFAAQQTLLARQAADGLQTYFADYGRALDYLGRQPGVQQLDSGGRNLLEDFLAIHPDDIAGVQRQAADGRVLFAAPGGSAVADDNGFCEGLGNASAPAVSDVVHATAAEGRVFFAAPVRLHGRFDGCVAFTLPFARVAGRHLGTIPLLADSYVLLVNSAGDILHAPDPGLAGGHLDRLPGAAADVAALGARLHRGEPGLSVLGGDPLRAPASGTGRRYAVAIPVALPGGGAWSMVIVTPAAEVVGAMAGFRAQWLLVTGIAVCAVGLLSFLLSGAMTRRREEAHRRAAEEQLAGLLEFAPMGVLLTDADGLVIYANQEATAMAAAAGRSLLGGRPLVAMLEAACRQAAGEQIRRAAAGRAEPPLAVRLAGDGPPRQAMLTATPYRQDGGGQCIVVVRDVTAERAAEESRSRLAEAVDQVQEAVLIADRRGTIEYVNAALAAMTGYSREESIGQPVRMLLEKEQEAHFDQQIEELVNQGEVWRGRLVNRRRDGSLFMAATTVSPVRDSAGAITHFISVQRDITHEAEVETRMRQAQKMEAIGTLAGGIAHDFNNILGGIVGFTDMALLYAEPGSEVHGNLLHIRQGGRRAADLVQQILTFSRQSAAEKVPVLIAPIIRESLKLLRASLPATIAIDQQLTGADVRVLATPVQIQQIVMNLCANAFHAMREQGGTLTIRLAEADADADGGRLSLTVADTGQGIDHDLLDRIFTPFFTTKKPGEGTGMGLSVVHGIVTDLGGEISVQSEPGRGTTFVVLLPSTEARPGSTLVSSEGVLPTGREHILVIDDEKEIRDICRMMLGHLGYTVTTLGRPEEALGLLADARPRIDLVITDQTMPRLTGAELTAAIRRDFPGLPVILCTGYSDRLNYDLAREAGACDLLMKPVDLRGLGAAVRAALDMHAG